MSDERPDTLAAGRYHEVHEMPDGTAFVGTAEEAALAAAEARGYDRAIANLRAYIRRNAHPAGELAADLRQALADLEAQKETPDDV